jgi:hypothetical protein
VQSELYELPRRLEGRFDIVYTSFGAIYWLPDIEGWAGVIDHFLEQREDGNWWLPGPGELPMVFTPARRQAGPNRGRYQCTLKLTQLSMVQPAGGEEPPHLPPPSGK